MAISVDDLKSTISKAGGVARGNMFNVLLPSLGNDTRELNMLCTVSALPGRQIMSADKTMGTSLRKIANGYAITDLNMTFLCTNSHVVKNYFETWQSLAHNFETNEIGYYYDYVRPVVIQHVQRSAALPLLKKQLDVSSVPSFILNRLPDIGPLQLSQGELDLNFSYDEQPVYTVVLEEAYPTTISDIQLNNQADNIMELQVQLSYKNWASGRAQPRDELGTSIAGLLISKLFGNG